MILHIKNMVCLRCKMLVKKILDDLELKYSKVDIGYIELPQPISDSQKESFKEVLSSWGLILIEDNNKILVEKIKNSVTNMIHDDFVDSSLKTSYYLSNYLNYNYTYLANVFSQETGSCLRDFIIACKIEKVKELLVYESLTVSEIAWKLNYSSVAHLSNQFIKITGLRPSEFKKKNGIPYVSLGSSGLLQAV